MKKSIIIAIALSTFLVGCGTAVSESVQEPIKQEETVVEETSVVEESAGEGVPFMSFEDAAAEITFDDFDNALDFNDYLTIFYNEEQREHSEKLAFLGESEDGKVKLYNIVHCDDGCILKADNVFFPVNAFVDPGWGFEVFNVSDYDGDGNDEYAFVHTVGRGTGFLVEELILADSQEETIVRSFGVEDMSEAFDKINYEYSEDSKTLEFWLDIDGEKTIEGTVTFDDELAERGFERLISGDQFYVKNEDGKIIFIADSGVCMKDGGWAEYEYGVTLIGDIVCKEGTITYDNLKLEARVPENS